MTDLFRAYYFPERYAVEVPIEKVVFDGKVDEGHVETISKSLDDVALLRPLVLVKHPKEEAYAVLDGHHRFAALKRTGAATVHAAVVDDYIGLGFQLTSKGTFQPHPEFTRYVRVPIKRFVAQMEEFLKDPEGVLRKQWNNLRTNGRKGL